METQDEKSSAEINQQPADVVLGKMEVSVKLLLLSLIVCVVLRGTAAAAQTSLSSTSDQAALVEGNNTFAVELYSQLRNQSGNLFFSPNSISIALAMTYAGARGATASEMEDTLHFTLPPERLHPAMGALLRDLNAAHDGYQLRVADALWAEKDYTFLDAFLKLTNSDYGAGFNQVDFKGAPEAARLTINQWVEQKTENKITNLLAPGMVDATTRLVLTNAIYFKGDWQTTFDKAQTKDEGFHLSPEQTIRTPLMHRTGGFKYLNGGTFQALEIPYKTGELSMIVFLPNVAGGLSALERSLTAYNMRKWLGQLQPASKVILGLPKVKMTQEFDLGDTLKVMGVKQAFDGRMADFTGMASRKAEETNLSERVAEFHERQQKLVEGSETIAFSQSRGTADLIRAYPFLRVSLDGLNTVHIAKSLGNGTGVNILFVYKQGNLLPDRCGKDGCGLDVYVDDGTGYKQALNLRYTGTDIHVSRVNGQVELFIVRTPTSFRTGGLDEFVLQHDVFLFRPTPHAQDCCGAALRFSLKQRVVSLSISAVIHKAYLDVDEEGTEAAAATAIVMTRATGVNHRPPPPPIIFCADHPFMFLIRDNRSGRILFMGRVVNPNTSPGSASGVTLAPGETSTHAEDQQRY